MTDPVLPGLSYNHSLNLFYCIEGVLLVVKYLWTPLFFFFLLQNTENNKIKKSSDTTRYLAWLCVQWLLPPGLTKNINFSSSTLIVFSSSICLVHVQEHFITLWFLAGQLSKLRCRQSVNLSISWFVCLPTFKKLNFTRV